MRGLLQVTVGLVLAVPRCAGEHGEAPSPSAYREMVTERGRLVGLRDALALEAGAADQEQPYLVVDLDDRSISLRMSGATLRSVPMRCAPVAGRQSAFSVQYIAARLPVSAGEAQADSAATPGPGECVPFEVMLGDGSRLRISPERGRRGLAALVFVADRLRCLISGQGCGDLRIHVAAGDCAWLGGAATPERIVLLRP